MNEPQVRVDVDIRLEEPTSCPIDEVFVSRVLGAAANVVGKYGEISVSFVSDEEIHDLNRTYRDVDRPTDVLSFALTEGDDEWSEVEGVPGGPILGDIVVSVPTAIRQAEEYGHSVERELGFLLVHGYLHLVGYDHGDEAGEKEMFTLQERVLSHIGLQREPASNGDAL